MALFSTKHEIVIEVDEAQLSRYSDAHLAALWHVAQANPADGFENKWPGELAAKIGWEIITRWLRTTPPELYHHQAHHYWSKNLGRFAKYEPGGPSGSAEWEAGTWVLKPDAIQATNDDGDAPEQR